MAMKYPMALPVPAEGIIFVKGLVPNKCHRDVDLGLRVQDPISAIIVSAGRGCFVSAGDIAIFENYCLQEILPGLFAISVRNLIAVIPGEGSCLEDAELLSVSSEQDCCKKTCEDLFAKTTKHIEGLVQAIKTVYGEKNDKVALNPTRQGIFGEISAERDYQDKKWGGPAIDDTRSYQDFVNWINEYGNGRGRASNYDCRTRMIKTAALAVAAIESMDRKNKCDDCDICRD